MTLTTRTKPNKDILEKIENLQNQLELPLFPEEHTLTWKAFCSLHVHRSNTGFGVSCLTYTDIEAFCRLTDTILLPNEVAGISVCDAAFMSVYANQAKASRQARQQNSSAPNSSNTKTAPAPTPSIGTRSGRG